MRQGVKRHEKTNRNTRVPCGRDGNGEILQARLNELGYYAGPVDGIPGRGTRRAIAAFERTNALDSDGNVDSAMLQALFSSDAGKMPQMASEPSEPVTRSTNGSADTSTVAENAPSPGTATGTTGVTEETSHTPAKVQADCEKVGTLDLLQNPRQRPMFSIALTLEQTSSGMVPTVADRCTMQQSQAPPKLLPP